MKCWVELTELSWALHTLIQRGGKTEVIPPRVHIIFTSLTLLPALNHEKVIPYIPSNITAGSWFVLTPSWNRPSFCSIQSSQVCSIIHAHSCMLDIMTSDFCSFVHPTYPTSTWTSPCSHPLHTRIMNHLGISTFLHCHIMAIPPQNGLFCSFKLIFISFNSHILHSDI